jgi:predicted esterase
MAFAACDSLEPVPPTLTPIRELSGPTLEASPTFLILPPTEVPPDFANRGQSGFEIGSAPFEGALPPISIGISPTSGASIVQITLSDGRNLRGELYENRPTQLSGETINQRLPGIVLLGEAPERWGEFPAQLRDAGYTVLVMNADAPTTGDDVSAILQSLSDALAVNPGLMAVIGASQGADLALVGCAVEALCDTAILLSPTSADTLINLMTDYNPRPLMVAASSEDALAYNTALALQTAARGDFSLAAYDNAGHGIELLTNAPDLISAIIDWLNVTLIPQ